MQSVVFVVVPLLVVVVVDSAVVRWAQHFSPDENANFLQRNNNNNSE